MLTISRPTRYLRASAARRNPMRHTVQSRSPHLRRFVCCQSYAALVSQAFPAIQSALLVEIRFTKRSVEAASFPS